MLADAVDRFGDVLRALAPAHWLQLLHRDGGTRVRHGAHQQRDRLTIGRGIFPVEHHESRGPRSIAPCDVFQHLVRDLPCGD